MSDITTSVNSSNIIETGSQAGHRREHLIIVLAFILGHFLLLTNTGVYWDDWTIIGNDSETIITGSRQGGFPLVGILHAFIVSFENALSIYRAIIFSCYLLSALLLNSILRTIREMDAPSRLFVVIVFALFPVNFARVAVINTSYAITYALFFCGFWLVSRYLSTGSRFFRLAALPFFFLSFTTNSLLVFYLLVIMYIIYIRRLYDLPFRTGIRSLASLSDYVLIVPAYWLIKQAMFRPYGVYEGYNQLTVKSVFRSFSKLLPSIQVSFLQPLNEAAAHLVQFPFSLLLIALLLGILWKKNIGLPEESRKDSAFLYLGIFCMSLALLPYLLVGKRPLLHSWDSRHQLLVPLGAALTLVYGANLITARFSFNSELRTFLYSVITLLLIASDINGYIAFEKDSYKHLSLVEQLKACPRLKDAKTVQFTDNTLHLNATGRDYSWYEYTGVLHKAYGDETRFASAAGSFGENHAKVMKWHKGEGQIKDYFLRSRNISQYEPGDGLPEFEVIIQQGEAEISDDEITSLITSKFFRPDKFRAKIEKMVSLRVVPLKNGI